MLLGTFCFAIMMHAVRYARLILFKYAYVMSRALRNVVRYVNKCTTGQEMMRSVVSSAVSSSIQCIKVMGTKVVTLFLSRMERYSFLAPATAAKRTRIFVK